VVSEALRRAIDTYPDRQTHMGALSGTVCEIIPLPTGARNAALRAGVAQELATLLETAVTELENNQATAIASLANALSLLQPTPDSQDNTPKGGKEPNGLAKWQARRVCSFIEEHFDQTITIVDLSRAARSSASHFSRSFRKTFGQPPHAYLMAWRIQRAREMMLTSDMPLTEIALSCGFSDQAHLTRLFRRAIGESPAAWRRERRP